MNLSFSSELNAGPRISKLADLLDGGLVAAPSLGYSFGLLEGISSGQANRMFLDRRTLAATTFEDLNLVSLTDVFGVALAFVLLKWMFVRVYSGTGVLAIGGAAANGFVGPFNAYGNRVKLKLASTPLVLGDPDGWSVVPATGHLFRMENLGAGPMDYDVCLLGTDA